jgi:3'-phosphoadenosine 5'-phosphosulfate sulfotransferase (PAPS reductase)/FAD synthetase
MEISELHYLQNLTLEEKILKTQTRIIEWGQHWNWNVYVSFSGGKDSTVLLDIVRKVAKEYHQTIPAVFCDTGLELPDVKKFVKSIDNVIIIRPEKNFNEIIANYGYPVISKEVSHFIEYARKGSAWALNIMNEKNPSSFKKRYLKYKYLYTAPFKISSKCCYFLKKRPFRKYEQVTKTKRITAIMASESMLRKVQWLKTGCNAFTGDHPHSNPMSFWTEQDVLRYIMMYQLPYADDVYGNIVRNKKRKLVTTKCQRTGCAFCMFGIHRDKEPNRIQLLQEQYPKLYKYCIEKLELQKVLEFLGVPFQYKELPLFVNNDFLSTDCTDCTD